MTQDSRQDNASHHSLSRWERVDSQRAIRALVQSEQMYRTLIDGLPDIVLFGENFDSWVVESAFNAARICDLMLVMDVSEGRKASVSA